MDRAERDKLVERIRALLRLGDRDKNSSPHERQNAVDLAHRLMAKYRIEQAELNQAQAAPPAREFSEAKQERARHLDTWQRILSLAAAELTGCRSVIRYQLQRSSRITWYKHVSFYGDPVATAVAEAAYHELAKSCMSLAMRMYPGKPRKKVRREFCESFATAVHIRALEKKDAVDAGQAEQYALVVKSDQEWIDAELIRRGVIQPARELTPEEKAAIKPRKPFKFKPFKRTRAQSAAAFRGWVEGREQDLNFKNKLSHAAVAEPEPEFQETLF